MPEYRRGIVIENPHSSHARHPLRQARIHHGLKTTGLELVHIVSDKDCVLTDRLFDLQLREGDVVFGVGGDGTAHRLANLALSQTGEEIGFNAVPFVPVRGGNACDIAYMLNGRSAPGAVMANGHEVDIHALEVLINGNHFAHAIGYAGLNADAIATEELDRLKHTFSPLQRRLGVQLYRETFATLDTMANATPVEVRDNDDNWQEATHLTFLNGPRIAKLGRSHARLDASQFEIIKLNTRTRQAVLGNMLRMGVGQLYGQMADSAEFQVRPVNVGESGEGDIAMQVDGEVSHVTTDENGLRIRVAPSQKKLKTISTRLPKAA